METVETIRETDTWSVIRNGGRVEIHGLPESLDHADAALLSDALEVAGHAAFSYRTSPHAIVRHAHERRRAEMAEAAPQRSLLWSLLSAFGFRPPDPAKEHREQEEKRAA